MIDDDRKELQLWQNQLMRVGFPGPIFHFECPEHAFRELMTCKDWSPDCILINFNVSRLRVDQLPRQLRNLKLLGGTTIVIHSSAMCHEVKSLLIEMGVDMTINRPRTTSDYLEAVSRLVRETASSEELLYS